MLLGEKWFNEEEVIRIMTDIKNVVYKKKVKVYSETFKEYRWMKVNDIEYNYTRLIPVAFMRLVVIKANSASRNMDDLVIEVWLNKKSVFTDEAQIQEEEEYGYRTYSTLFTRLNLLIDSAEELMEEDYRILDDPKKPLPNKLNELIDKVVDEDEDYNIYEHKLQGLEFIEAKSIIKFAVYINDYYDSILELIKPKLYLYDDMVKNAFNEIKKITKIDFKITKLKQVMEMLTIFPNMDVRLNIDDFPIKEAKPVNKDKELNTLYTFDHETMMYIVKYSFARRIYDFMILKYWYDIDITSFTYKYRLIRNTNTGDLFIILCKTGELVYNQYLTSKS